MLRNLKKKEILKNSSRNPRIRPTTQRKRFQQKKKQTKRLVSEEKKICDTKDKRSSNKIQYRFKIKLCKNIHAFGSARRKKYEQKQEWHFIRAQRNGKNEVSISNAIVENFFASFLSCLWRCRIKNFSFGFAEKREF